MKKRFTLLFVVIVSSVTAGGVEGPQRHSAQTAIQPTGKPYVTLKHTELGFISEKHLKPSADAYTDPIDQQHPNVSLVYGDFSKGFLPELIHGL